MTSVSCSTASWTQSGQARAVAWSLSGDAGVGKSALIDYLVAQAAGCRVARIVGIQSEMELAFAGLRQLCGPILDRLDDLPDPQRTALSIAFGLLSGVPPDRFLIGLATLSLLAEAAARQPLVCVIDDAQWLDSASLQALTFAARRMAAERVGVVFAVRDGHSLTNFEGLSELAVTGLGDHDARAAEVCADRAGRRTGDRSDHC